MIRTTPRTYFEGFRWSGMVPLNPDRTKWEDEWMPQPTPEETIAYKLGQLSENEYENIYSWQYVGKRLRFKCKRCGQFYSISFSHAKSGGPSAGGYCHQNGSLFFPCEFPDVQEEYFQREAERAAREKEAWEKAARESRSTDSPDPQW